MLWAIRLPARASIGAMPGLIISILLLSFVEALGFLTLEPPVTSDRRFLIATGLGITALTLVSVTSGDAKLTGRGGTITQGVLAGVAVGVVAGYGIGYLLGRFPELHLPPKAVTPFGIYLGGPVGGIIGGLLAAQFSDRRPRP